MLQWHRISQFSEIKIAFVLRCLSGAVYGNLTLKLFMTASQFHTSWSCVNALKFYVNTIKSIALR